MGSASPRRAIRIANCSGANPDPGYKMLEQAISGETAIDGITGDYLAEFNLSANTLNYKSGKHPGWERTCEDGIMQTLEVANEKRIKIVVNGGALNPKGLAELVQNKVTEKGYNLKVAYVSGDDIHPRLKDLFPDNKFTHLDKRVEKVKVDPMTQEFEKHMADGTKPIISAHAYLGARGIVTALRADADIVICGRVADASPPIGLAAWWHGWTETDFDALAGALVAGHLIECACYSTGGNFCNFTQYTTDQLVPLGYPIAEIAFDGTCVITKHENLKGFVNVDTVRSQFLYELQGAIYLNSDVKADTTNIYMEQVGENRVRVSGVKGHPPPPTTKLAIFYQAAFQMEAYFGATGTAFEVSRKFALHEAQVKWALKRRNQLQNLAILEFQQFGLPEENPSSQTKGTALLRMMAQAESQEAIVHLQQANTEMSMQHYHGMHASLDHRTQLPRPLLAFYPALIQQRDIRETATLLNPTKIIDAGNVSVTEALTPQPDHETVNPVSLQTFGATKKVPLGTVVLARSGDKGGNGNVGFFVRKADEYPWLCSLLTKSKVIELLGEDWKPEYHLERVEMPRIYAVHFVIYGILGSGVSSSTRVDCFGKGVADYLRAKFVDVPVGFLGRYVS